MRICQHCPLLMMLISAAVFLPATVPSRASCEENNKEEKRLKVEVELDPYYSSVGLYASLTKKPIPFVGEKPEWEIYKDLLKKFYMPRTLVIETSINPLPYAGTLIRNKMPEFYQSAKANDSLNVVQAVTTGFEEPWAASLFLGNVIAFRSARKSYEGKRHGYTGLLLDVGNFHIKDNELIPDRWMQMEWKIKGEQFVEDRNLLWSFRAGVKFHGNTEIADAFYVAFRRNRTDFGGRGNFFLNNSGFEYIFDMAQKDLEALRHYFMINKKIVFSKPKMALTLAVGMVWTSDNKYSGSLAVNSRKDKNPFQVLFQPNLEF